MKAITPIYSAGGMALDAWLERIGRSRTLGWRWRKKGWIKAIQIEGLLYVLDTDIDRFWKRAAKGEFAKDEDGSGLKELTKAKGAK